MLLLSSLTCAVALSCGSDSTGPGGGGNGVTITPSTDSLPPGSTVALHATVDGATGSPSIFWSSENTSIATVSGSGVVTAIALGTVRIAASSSGKSGVATIVVIPPPVASVRVSPTSAAIKVGETVHLIADPLDASGNVLTGRTINWSSSDASVATVDNTGLVKGLTEGTATITATSEGKSGTAGIAVASAVGASITVAPTSVTVTAGQTSQLTATVKDASGSIISGAPVSWNVDKSSIAIVSSTGLVAGQAAGSATITATSGSAHITVPVTVTLPPANAVVVSPLTVALLVTQQQQLTGTVTDAGGNTIPNQPISWQSNNTAVATVSNSGLVTAGLPGTATITATSGTVSGTAQVTVSLVPARRVTLTPDAVAFTQGDPGTQLTVALLDSAGNTLSLTGRPISWSSNKASVASVNGSGFVTPGAPGQAVITATLTGTGLSATSTVTVTPVPVASVLVSPSPDTLNITQQIQLTATPEDASGNPLAGRTVVWDGSDDAIATVSSNGRVTALSPGTMTVTATSEGKTGTATIVVNAAPVASVAISPTTQSVIVGQTTPAFTAVTKDGSGNVLTGRTVTFSSSNTSVATIDATSGVATGVAAGTTSITATSEGKTSNAATLTVTDIPVGSVEISPTTQSVQVGQSTPAFTAVTKDGSGNVLTGRTVTFSSSSTDIATIDPTSGVATGVSAGTTSITAASEGKTSSAATLTVTPVAVGSVTISPKSASVDVGSSTPAFTAVTKDDKGHPLTGRTIAWNSSNALVATIDASGVATGVSPGTSSITAMSEGKTSNTATLMVNPAPVSTVAVSPATQTIIDGESATFTATLQDANGNTLTDRTVSWKSSNGMVATIDNTGNATSTGPGTTTITATSEGKSGTASLQVDPAPVTVAVTPAFDTTTVGATVKLVASVQGGIGAPGPVSWSSADDTIATVDDHGTVRGVSAGDVSIIATAKGAMGSSQVTVLP
jgi:Bacterial surface proteins containing Ig-like domains